jgi:uncharacterized protein
MSGSAIYEGWVTHRRLGRTPHEFRYRLSLPLFDLDELPELLDPIPLWSARRPAGPVRLLANPRYLGLSFNPISLYFLHEGDGGVGAVIAEVTNTPWGERTTYVLDGSAERGDRLAGSFAKSMHVSPFQPMDQRYEISVTPPADGLAAQITSIEAGTPAFSAGMALRRRPMTREAMLGLLLRRPAPTAMTLGRIYGQALRLWAKGAPRHPHPATGS